jgi:hypothetical protein
LEFFVNGKHPFRYDDERSLYGLDKIRSFRNKRRAHFYFTNHLSFATMLTRHLAKTNQSPNKSRGKNALSQKRLRSLIDKAQNIDATVVNSEKRTELNLSDLRTDTAKGALLLWVYYHVLHLQYLRVIGRRIS